MDLKTVDLLNQRKFIANGVNYVVRDKVSIRRYREYQKLEPYLTFGISAKEIFNGLTKIEAANNKGDRNSIGVICYNMKAGIKECDSEARYPIALQMAALVIDREDEDPGSYDADLMNEKIRDWEAEGLDMSAFFTLTLHSIAGFKETFLSFIQQQAQVIEKSDLMEKSK